MSKIKIQGNASGTGVVTLTAPNTNTDRTITLPDGTDTLIGTATTDALTTRVNGAGGRKNLIINGDMRVAQRGTSETGVASLGYKNSADRFIIQYESAGTWTVSQSTEAPEGFSNSYKFDCTTADASLAADDYLRLDQKIEAQDLQHLKYGTSNAESITVSFWVRSVKTGTYTVELQHGEVPSSYRYAGLQYTINSANTWEKKALTFSGQTANAINNDTGTGLEIHWYLAVGSAYTSGGYTAGTFRESNATSTRCSGQTVNLADSTSNDWHITGVQLELGSVATDFEHRSYGEELALCQRYFYNFSGWVNGALTISQMVVNSFVNYSFISFPVEMRAQPTFAHNLANSKIVIGGPGGDEYSWYWQNQGYIGNSSAGDISTTSGTIFKNGASLGNYYNTPSSISAGVIRWGNQIYLQFSAEL